MNRVEEEEKEEETRILQASREEFEAGHSIEQGTADVITEGYGVKVHGKCLLHKVVSVKNASHPDLRYLEGAIIRETPDTTVVHLQPPYKEGDLVLTRFREASTLRGKTYKFTVQRGDTQWDVDQSEVPNLEELFKTVTEEEVESGQYKGPNSEPVPASFTFDVSNDNYPAICGTGDWYFQQDGGKPCSLAEREGKSLKGTWGWTKPKPETMRCAQRHLQDSLEAFDARYSIQEAKAQFVTRLQPSQKGDSCRKWKVTDVETAHHDLKEELEGAVITMTPNTAIVLPQDPRNDLLDTVISADQCRVVTSDDTLSLQFTLRKGSTKWDVPDKMLSGKEGSLLNRQEVLLNPFDTITTSGVSKSPAEFSMSRESKFFALDVNKDGDSHSPGTCDWQFISDSRWSLTGNEQRHAGTVRYTKLKQETAPTEQLGRLSI